MRSGPLILYTRINFNPNCNKRKCASVAVFKYKTKSKKGWCTADTLIHRIRGLAFRAKALHERETKKCHLLIFASQDIAIQTMTDLNCFEGKLNGICRYRQLVHALYTNGCMY